MKVKNLLYLFASLCLVLSSCDSDDDKSGSASLPEGAFPSAEFKTNNLPEEPYAEDVIKIVTEAEDAPFYSLELMADGHYLLSSTRPSDAKTMSVEKNSDGGFMIHKRGNAKRVQTRSVDDGTIDLGNGMTYGTFQRIGRKVYSLSDGSVVNLQKATDLDRIVKYKNSNGTVSNIYISVSKPLSNGATSSLCRTWNMNSLEVWGLINNVYVAHGKQTLSGDGHVETYWKAAKNPQFDLDKDDFLDPDDEMCYKIVFTSNGTYICFYLDGTSDAAYWEWTDPSQGSIHTWDPVNYPWEERDDMFFTVRFAGSQMRLYYDLTDTEDGDTGRVVQVVTCTAAQ